ncbi:ubiquitin--protein ligase [Escherichia coli]|nr:ubiquitin--protein ligase [Escherichia coli]
MRLFCGSFLELWTRYGAATSRFFAIYELFQGGGGGFVVCSIFMNEKGKMQTIHQPEAVIKLVY